MKNTKKAELTLQVVVVAVLLLLVLVVLTFVFSSRMGIFSSGIRHCDTVCVAKASECEEKGYDVPAYWNSCQDSTEASFKGVSYCCLIKSS